MPMQGDLRGNPRAMYEAVRELILSVSPNMGINDLCRLAMAQGIPTSKHLVREVRQQLRKVSARSTEAALTAVTAELRAEAAENPDAKFTKDGIREKLDKKWDAEIEIALGAMPPLRAVQELERNAAAKEAGDAERERKAAAQAAREAKWAERAKEKEAEWEAERKAEEEAEAAKPPLQLTEVVPEEIAVSLPEPMPVPRASPPKVSVEPEPLDSTGRKKTTAGMMVRRQYINNLLDDEPGADPVMLIAKTRARFGIGLDWWYVYDTCRVARELHQLPQIPENPHGRGPGAGVRLPTFPGPVPEGLKVVSVLTGQTVEPEYADTPDEECRWLARQGADIMRAHKLTELKLTLENGKAKWTFTAKGDGEMTL